MKLPGAMKWKKINRNKIGKNSRKHHKHERLNKEIQNFFECHLISHIISFFQLIGIIQRHNMVWYELDGYFAHQREHRGYRMKDIDEENRSGMGKPTPDGPSKKYKKATGRRGVH